MSKLLEIDQALEKILSYLPTLAEETIPLSGALHRVLREDLIAETDQPPFDRSAMDGFAVHQVSEPGRWRQVRVIAARDAAGEALRPGQCARILTGGAVPPETWKVIPQELTRQDGERISAQKLDGPDYIRRRGADCKKGEQLLRAGRRLSAPEIAALAQHGMAGVKVGRFPKIVHLSTGDELIDHAQKPVGSQMRDSNSPLIAALLAEAGIPPDHLRQTRASDTLEAALDKLAPTHWETADVLLISGGAGFSERDIAGAVLASLGFEIILRGVNMRPGKPLIFGRRGAQICFVLPGNPVSHWVTWQVFVRPALDAMLGETSRRETMTAPLAANWPVGGDRRPLRWPARLCLRDGKLAALPLNLANSGDISRMADARALISHTPNSADLAQGQPVAVQLISDLL